MIRCLSMSDYIESIRNALPGIVWPAIPDDAGARVLAMQFQFEQTESWPLADLEREQLRQLQSLLQHAHGAAAFWRDRLENAGYRRDLALTPEWFRSLPCITDADIRPNAAALTGNSVPADHGVVRGKQIGDPGGAPVGYAETELAGFLRECFTLREHCWHKRDFSGKLVIAQPLLPWIAGGWGQAISVALNTIPVAILNVAAPIDQQLAWLEAQNPDYLFTFSLNAAALARRARERRLRWPRLREVRTTGEVPSPEVRALVKDAWGVGMVDSCFLPQLGYVALQCPQHDHFHVQSESVLVEIIDDGGNPCIEGRVGHVVVTPLHNFAMPLIRYRTGELAEPGPPCDCGRTLPVIRNVSCAAARG
jgi:phenylacetate-CoA ligase